MLLLEKGIGNQVAIAIEGLRHGKNRFRVHNREPGYGLQRPRDLRHTGVELPAHHVHAHH